MQFYTCIVNMTLFCNLFRLQHINMYKNATLLGGFGFKFVGEAIELVLEKEQMKDGWIISPQHHPCIVRITCIYIMIVINIIPIWLHVLYRNYWERLNAMACVILFRRVVSLE